MQRISELRKEAETLESADRVNVVCGFSVVVLETLTDAAHDITEALINVGNDADSLLSDLKETLAYVASRTATFQSIAENFEEAFRKEENE